MMENKIDFVVAWVDGIDKEWLKERNIYARKDPEDVANYRFRDWDNLKYWFRGVEKYAPWVNNIYFVTNWQKPNWLNINHPKLKWVKHEDFIPKEYLPTFNFHTIEHNLYRINGLSEKFVFLKGLCSDLYNRYKEYAMYVMTSRFEGFPMVNIEAHSAKLPIISFDCPCGPSEQILDEQNGYIIECFDVDKMAEKINFLIEHSEIRKQMSDNTSLDKDKLKMDNIIKEWEKII